MAHVPLEGDADGAGLQTIADDVLHRRDLVFSGMPFLGCVAHDVAADGGVSDEGGDIHAKPPIQRIEVLRDGLPGPVHAGPNGL